MYSIYIKNFKNTSGQLVSENTLLYSIPIQNSDNALLEPVVTCEIGKTGTFEFAVHPKHPYYDAFVQMRTIMMVYYDEDVIFRGRVLTIDTDEFSGQKQIHCEGDLAFLLDSAQESSKEEDRSEISVASYLQSVIAVHNAQMREGQETDKMIVVGQVPGAYSQAIHADQRVSVENRKFGSNSWENSLNAIESLQNEFGGYFRTRYENGTVYLDWLTNYFNSPDNIQPIEIAENLISINNSKEVNNIFTALIPIGSAKGENVYIDGYQTAVHGSNNKRILVPQITSVFSDAELNSGYRNKSDYEHAIDDYGLVYRVEQFPNADTQEKLWAYATDWIKNNYIGGLTTFTITALDMHHVNGEIEKHLTGDKVTVIYPDISHPVNGVPPKIAKTLTILRITHNLHNPGKNEYSIGIPSDVINKTYGTKNKSSSSKSGATASLSSLGAGLDNKSKRTDKDLKEDKDDLDRLAWRYVLDGKYNNEEWAAFQQLYPDANDQAAAEKLSYIAIVNSLTDTPGGNYRYYSMIHNGNRGEITIMQNPAYVAQAEATWNAAKSIVINGYENKLSLKEKAQKGLVTQHDIFAVEMSTQTGTSATMEFLKAKREGTLSEWFKSAKVDGEEGSLNSMLGKFGLNGAGDKATIVADGVQNLINMFPVDSQTGLPSLSSFVNLDGQSGTGGFGKKQDNTSWKVKLNDTVTYVDKSGTTRTASGFVRAEDFDIDDSIPSLKTKLLVVDELVAGKATIGDLAVQTARIDDLEATVVYADDLYVSGGTYAGYVRSTNGFYTPDGLMKAKKMVSDDMTTDILYLYNNIQVPDGGGSYSTFSDNRLWFGNGTLLSHALMGNSLRIGLDARVDPNNPGHIIISFADNSDGSHASANFNIAATQFYLDHVAAAYTNAVNRVSWPTTPRTQKSFSVSVPGNPWNESTETGTTLNRIFALSAGNFDSNHISTVELAMSHNENGQAVADGVVAKIDVDASDVYSAGDSAGYSRGYLKGMDDVGVYITKNGSWVSSWTVQSGDSETFYPAKWINGSFDVDTSHGLTVTASGGGSDSSNIDLANSGQIWLHSSDPGSGYVKLESLGSRITEGKNNGSAYVTFQATCDGGTTYKYYKIPL